MLIGNNYYRTTDQNNSSKYEWLEAEKILGVLVFSVENSAKYLPDVPLVVEEVKAHDEGGGGPAY